MPKLHGEKDVPARMLDNLRALVGLAASESVLVAYDETTFGSGKAGFAITGTRFIELDGEWAQSIALDDIAKISIRELEIPRYEIVVERSDGADKSEIIYLTASERDKLSSALEQLLPGRFFLTTTEGAHDESLWQRRLYRGTTGMTLTTAPTIEGKVISAYHGVVSGEAVLGASFFADLSAGIADFMGGRSLAYERELCRARETALRVMEGAARRGGGNAVIAIKLDYEAIGSSMLMVSASGTAVTVA